MGRLRHIWRDSWRRRSQTGRQNSPLTATWWNRRDG